MVIGEWVHASDPSCQRRAVIIAAQAMRSVNGTYLVGAAAFGDLALWNNENQTGDPGLMICPTRNYAIE